MPRPPWWPERRTTTGVADTSSLTPDLRIVSPSLLDCVESSRCGLRCPLQRRRHLRPEVLAAKRVRVQAAAIDLHAQHFFQSHIAEPYLRSEMIEERELARLIGRFEGHYI